MLWTLGDYGYAHRGDNTDAVGAAVGSSDKLTAVIMANRPNRPNGPIAGGIHATACQRI